jgi:hypothetical protein
MESSPAEVANSSQNTPRTPRAAPFQRPLGMIASGVSTLTYAQPLSSKEQA